MIGKGLQWNPEICLPKCPLTGGNMVITGSSLVGKSPEVTSGFVYKILLQIMSLLLPGS